MSERGNDMQITNMYFSWCKGITIITILAILFFDRWWVAFVLLPISMFIVRQDQKTRLKHKHTQYLINFRHLLQLLSQAMSAGQSAEKAMHNAVVELKNPSQTADEFQNDVEKLSVSMRNGISIEQVFMQLAKKYPIDEIRMFADLFQSAKRTSGNVPRVMRTIQQMISEKIDVKLEIDIMVAQKKLESRLLFIIPIVLLAILKWTSAEYLLPLYESFIGYMIMSIALLLTLIAYAVSKRILKFE
jgi:tight adherence protein B